MNNLYIEIHREYPEEKRVDYIIGDLVVEFYPDKIVCFDCETTYEELEAITMVKETYYDKWLKDLDKE